MSSDPELQQLEEQLAALDAERAKLIVKINSIRNASKTDTQTCTLPPLLGKPALFQPPITPAGKIQLFLKLFRCREDVFPKRWENTKSGKKGYSPTCKNEWVPGI